MEEITNPNEYRTGTASPKPRRTGPIAALFICVIFIGGLVSALSILGAHLEEKKAPPISFTQSTTESSSKTTGGRLGFSCQSMDITYQYLHRLPAGLYINHVEPGSVAERLGIVPGDVLISLNGTAVSTTGMLSIMLENLPENQPLEVVIYLAAKKIPITLTFREGE